MQPLQGMAFNNMQVKNFFPRKHWLFGANLHLQYTGVHQFIYICIWTEC